MPAAATDVVPNIQIRCLCDHWGDRLTVRLEALHDQNFLGVIRIQQLTDCMQDFYVTIPCKCGFDNPFAKKLLNEVTSDFKLDVKSGFMIEWKGKTEKSLLLYQLVKDNTLGQFCAVRPWSTLIVLQAGTCLSCTLSSIQKHLEQRYVPDHRKDDLIEVCLVACGAGALQDSV